MSKTTFREHVEAITFDDIYTDLVRLVEVCNETEKAMESLGEPLVTDVTYTDVILARLTAEHIRNALNEARDAVRKKLIDMLVRSPIEQERHLAKAIALRNAWLLFAPNAEEGKGGASCPPK